MMFIVTELLGNRALEDFPPFIGCKYSHIKTIKGKPIFKWVYDFKNPKQLDKLSREINRELILKINGVHNMPTLILGGYRNGI